MDTTKILNANLFPKVGDNVRRKDYPLYDTQSIATGQTEYYFFNNALGNQFLRNTKLPLAGTQVFFVQGLSGYLKTMLTTTALIRNLTNLLQKSYLQITIDGRVQCKLPGMDFIQYQTGLLEDATPEQLMPNITNTIRRFPIPILINSTSSYEIKLVIPSAEATAFNGVEFKLSLHGIMFDKLVDFNYDALKNNQFQRVPVTYYYTVDIANGNETTYNLFSSNNIAQGLFSQVFPLSEIQTFSCQNIEVLVNQPDTPIVPSTIYNSRIANVLRVNIDDVDYYNASMQDMLSVVAAYGDNLTDSAAATTAYVTLMNERKSKTLTMPIEFPAQSKVLISLTQPASSLGITGSITVALRGVETRRVA